jgi:cytoskeletal protein CcmA (bactofilin family)
MFKSSNTRDMPKTNEPHAPEKLNRIVAGTEIEGVIVSDSNIRIDGTVKGTVTAKGRLVVGSTGIIDGEIICENADIEGSIQGNMSVNGLLSLKSTARLECDIATKKLAIEPGAVFTGKCVMGGGVVKDLKQATSSNAHAGSTEQKRASES